MVRAILDGRKTVTRRVVKPQPKYQLRIRDKGCRKGEWHEYSENPMADKFFNRPWGAQYIPHCRPGDILYVRETWQYGFGGTYLYKADAGYDLFMTPDGNLVSDIPWRPSIHMPREAARLFLRVTDVRVERLQDMTDDDFVRDFGVCREAIQAVGRDALAISFWDSTVKKPADRALYGWAANPWVWVIAFERCEKQEENT